MKTSLVIMAAGIGSRYGGGIKQLAEAGPCGEIIMDYSIYDAKRAGFDKVVFIIRKDIEKDFRDIIGRRIESVCETEYVFQELDALPKGFSVPEGRVKPWGTGHAILSCAGVVNEPFAVINADDFYGARSFDTLHDYLAGGEHTQGKEDICLVGYVLGNTLSENGGVSRGVCKTENGMLISVNETKNIRRENGTVIADEVGELSAETLVSMNMWGLRPSFIEKLGDGFREFLASGGANELKSEFFLPMFIDGMIKNNAAEVRVLPTDEKWFGVTFKEDLPSVQQSVADLIKAGVYPENLMETMK